MAGMLKLSSFATATGTMTPNWGTPKSPRSTWELFALEVAVSDRATAVANQMFHIYVSIPTKDGAILFRRDVTPRLFTATTGGLAGGFTLDLHGIETTIGAAGTFTITLRNSTTDATIVCDNITATIFYR